MRVNRFLKSICIVMVLTIVMLSLCSCARDFAIKNTNIFDDYEIEMISTIHKYKGPGGDIVLPQKGSDNKTDIETIDLWAFEYNDKITSIVIPNGLKFIKASSFRVCTNLTSVSLPESVESIGKYAFAHCKSLSVINIPKKVKIIEEGLFKDCVKLTSINIPNGVTTIDTFSFEGCKNLETISIPSSVKIIAYCAFEGCENLKEVYYAGTQEQWEEIYNESGNAYLNGANIYFEVKAA